MANVIIAMLGSLVFLLIIAVYSAVCLGKKTDEMITVDEDAGPPFLVKFPESAFRATRLSLHQR